MYIYTIVFTLKLKLKKGGDTMKKPIDNIIQLHDKLQEKRDAIRGQKIKRLRQKFIRHAKELDWRK